MSPRWPARAAALLALVLLAWACGEDKDPPPAGSRDAGVEDGGVDAGRDAALVDIPMWPDASVQRPKTCTQRECNRLASECRTAVCNADTGECDTEDLEDGTACGSEDNTGCTRPDQCLAGECAPRHYDDGAPCGVERECHTRDTCDGAGSCVDRGYADEGSACGDDGDSECDAADSCDGAGKCLANVAELGTACGPDKHVDCGGGTFDDTCNGAGACIAQGIRKPDGALPGGQPRAGDCLERLSSGLDGGPSMDGNACLCGDIVMTANHPCPDRCNASTGACDVGCPQ